ncbi:MAG TPA: long-chain fatty acid--CoA ligase [Deltaproteobacteria bacterium]|nr:long-chain fatty acid--CoA ligase [Deltaproteobacteria bacterium]
MNPQERTVSTQQNQGLPGASVEWNVGSIISKRARLTPEKNALIYEDTPVTFKTLNDGTNRCAHLLERKGIKKGDRIGVLLLNCVEFLEAYFAAAKLGVIFVPLNWRMVGPELEYQLNDCSVRMLLFHDSFLGSVDLIRTRLKVEHDKFIFLKSGSPVLPGFELPKCPPWAEDYHELIKDQPVVEPSPEQPVKMDDPLAILYTSGVTGNPKGAMVSHMQTFFKNFQIALYVDGQQDDIVIAQMPLFHSGGLFIVATPCLMGGMTLVMRGGFDAEEFAQDIQRYRGTIVFALTTMWRLILDSGKLDQIDVSSVRCVVGGGERTPAKLFEELAKRDLFMQQGFGQTENSAMMLLPREDIVRKMGSIGKPGFFTEIWISNGNGKKLPPGEIGEIVARGPTVMSGYWNRPEETARTIVGGVLHTGDLGYMDEEGYFYIVDRAKDMYRSGGENVYPAEIEKILVTHPKVSMAAIIGVPDEKWGEVGMAFIVPMAGEKLTEREILEFLKGKIAKYKFPSKVEFLSELPLTATMKVKKAELKKRYAAR